MTSSAPNMTQTSDQTLINQSKPPELELNLRPGLQMSPPRATARSPPGLSGQSPGHNSSSQHRGQNMDDLADCFAGSFNVTNSVNDTNKPHPRFSQYKMKSAGISQEIRRKALLDHQKAKRDDLINHARALASGDFNEEENDEEEEEMDTSAGEVRQRKLRKTYKNQLMLSEWLVEVPVDLAEKWLMILCPEGRRNLVVAWNGSTKVYSKSGKQVKSFPSNLPGGNRSQNRDGKYTILDCIFSESNQIFYILDMMCWGGFQYYDCDTMFRFSWVQQKFIENQELRKRSRINPYSFQPLPVYQCTQEEISTALNSPMPFSDHLDGLLIYHKDVHYNPGKTPLVGWIKGFMVPELMGIQVCPELMEQKPSGYGSMKTYLKSTYDKNDKMKKAEEERLKAELENMVDEH